MPDFLRKNLLVVRIVCCLMFVISLVVVGGCGDGRPSLVPAEGTVTVDGEPIEGANVVFQVDQVEGDYSRPSSGRTDAQGKFKIGTYDKDDGLPVGTYKVGIIKKELMTKLPPDHNPEDPAASNRPMRYKWHTPRAVADPNTSGLTAEVTSEGLEPSTFALEGGGEIEVVGQRSGNEP